MRTSEAINELATSLAKAQAEVEGATKGKVNPAFKSKYADLSSVWEACREALTKHGLSVVQGVETLFDGGIVVNVTTRLIHSSGQWIESTIGVPVSKPDGHGVGSATTYGRRFGLSAMVGVAPEDDDANASVGYTGQQQPKAATVPAGFDDWFLDLAAVADNGNAALTAAWKKSDPDYRDYATKNKRKELDALKAKAANVAEAVTA